MKQYILSSFIYLLALLMSLTFSSCSGPEEMIPPEPEQPEYPDSNEGDTTESNGRYLVLFCSCSGISTSLSEARNLCANAMFAESLHLTSSTISQYKNRVTDWLTLLGVGNKEDDKDESQQKPNSLKINITIGNRVITATMEDHATARDFLSRLPLNVTLNDYGGAEKIFYPNPALTTDGATRGNASSRGDIDLYIPWGNIAFFYGGDGDYSNSMIHLGKIDGDGATALDVSGSISMRIERQE